MQSGPVPRRAVLALALVGALAFSVAALAWSRVSAAETAFNGTAYPDAPPAAEFRLTNHLGQPASLSDFRGAAVLLFFGFSSCPDVCPLTLSTVSRLLDSAELGPERVRVLLVSVDPVNDTPAVLADYIQPFGPSVTALTGSPEAIRAVQADYGVFAEKMTGHGGHASLAHTTLVFGIDAAGRLRALLHPEMGDDALLEDIHRLVKS